MSDRDDCQRIMHAGSRSFYLASRLLPRRLRRPVAAVYGFCREADDAVDTTQDLSGAVGRLHQRLDRIYGGTDLRGPVDRELASLVHGVPLPRALFNALLEGFAWDAAGKRYDTLEDVLAYGVRVAGSVGALMTLLMGVQTPAVLARACDLGAAMQLTNIARDVGEDARLGRLYLPRLWLQEAGIDPVGWLRQPCWTPALGSVVARLLAAAEPLYVRADTGISYLPADCRLGVYAARLIYADIGRVVAARGFNTMAGRAVVPGWRKTWRLLQALGAWTWRPQVNDAPVLPAAAPLVRSACVRAVPMNAGGTAARRRKHGSSVAS